MPDTEIDLSKHTDGWVRDVSVVLEHVQVKRDCEGPWISGGSRNGFAKMPLHEDHLVSAVIPAPKPPKNSYLGDRWVVKSQTADPDYPGSLAVFIDRIRLAPWYSEIYGWLTDDTARAMFVRVFTEADPLRNYS